MEYAGHDLLFVTLRRPSKCLKNAFLALHASTSFAALANQEKIGEDLATLLACILASNDFPVWF